MRALEVALFAEYAHGVTFAHGITACFMDNSAMSVRSTSRSVA